MDEKQKQEILDLLSELVNNIGDVRGRNGEYLSDQASDILEKFEALEITYPCCG